MRIGADWRARLWEGRVAGSGAPDDDPWASLQGAMAAPRGHYPAARTAQLSGIPRSTLYDWRRTGTFVPDYDGGSPAGWSYRDLVLLRLLAWLRQRGMDRPVVARQVARIKDELSAGMAVRFVAATQTELMVEPEMVSRTTGNLALPFDDLYAYTRTFDLADPVEELQAGDRRRLWAPDLVKPSARSAISPWVMAGEPCLERTRIPTSAIWALRTDRGLTASEIVALYPGIDEAMVGDADQLERQLRGEERPPLAA
ncbi:MAG: DUF433 domain-containing protein [Acidimicrobiales bacterium]